MRINRTNISGIVVTPSCQPNGDCPLAGRKESKSCTFGSIMPLNQMYNRWLSNDEGPVWS
jgi:hypothetical protein